MTDSTPHEEMIKLINESQSIILSTSSGEEPLASYAPFSFDQNNMEFYVSTSGLAAHTKNLERESKISFMIIEDESNCEKVFARKRITFQGTSKLIDKEGSDFQNIQKIICKRHGEGMKNMLALPDFRVFSLKPISGSLVLGFGKAYVLADDLKTLTHRMGHGHAHKN